MGIFNLNVVSIDRGFVVVVVFVFFHQIQHIAFSVGLCGCLFGCLSLVTKLGVL